MARFEMDGFDELLAEMKQLGELSGDVADEMLIAGAEEVKKAWKESALRHGHKDTRDMIDSIDYSRKPKTASDIRSIDIYPKGKDRKGVRNAEKAFILHYGKKGKPASQWVDDAEKRAEPAALAVMTEIWEKHLEGMK